MNTVALAGGRRGVRDVLTALRARQIAWLVFLSTLLIYFTLVPWVSRRWWLTGDEPHYLMVTHSLLTDGDLELSNNYQEKDFTLFYVGEEMDPHISVGPDGGAYPSHTIGLSVLLLPAYALGYLVFGTHAGVLYFLNTIGAFVAANVYLLCYEVTGRKFSSLLGWVTTAFTVPLMHYAYQVYPEIIGALLLVWSLRHIRRGKRAKTHTWLMVGASIGFLPWLVSRFILLSAFLGAAALFAIALADGTRRWRGVSITALCLPVIASAGLLMAFNLHIYGTMVPRLGTASPAFIEGLKRLPSLATVVTGVVGWVFDQDRGLLVYAPVYIVSLPGMLLMFEHRRRDACLFFLPVIGLYLAMCRLGYWTQWSIPVRWVVSVVPLLGVFIVYGVQRIGSRGFLGLGFALFLISLRTGWLLIREPQLIYAYRLHGGSGVLEAYGESLHMHVGEYIPSFRKDAVIYAWEGGPGEKGKAVSDPEAKGLAWAVASTGYVTWAESSTEEAGYILDRVWPSEVYPPLSPAGGYSACFRMKAGGGIPPERVVAVVEISTAQGVLAQKEIERGEFPERGYGISCLQFDYPGRQRFRFRVFFTDETDLWVDWVKLDYLGGSSRDWILSGFWLAALVAFTAYYYARYRSKPEGPGDEISACHSKVEGEKDSLVFKVVAALLIVLIIVTLGSYLYSLFTPRVFEAEGLRHLTGEVVIDEEASGGKAAYAGRGMEKNALVYGPHEFFGPGEYEARFRMKRSGASAEVEVAAIDVYGNASGVLALQTIMSDDFEGADRYQEFRLLFSNPAPQALQFRVFFTGAADLWVDKITLEKLEVVERQRNFALPSPDHPLEARLGEMVRLLGYDMEGDRVRSGEEIGLTLYWQALAPADRPYKVFTHLIDEENAIWGQHDSQPVGGTYPPNLWVTGEVVADSHRLSVAGDAPSGIYRLEVGMYYEPTGQRLPVYIEGERVEEDRILLGEIEVVK